MKKCYIPKKEGIQRYAQNVLDRGQIKFHFLLFCNYMNIKQIVGDNIRFIREKKGLTQDDISVITKMSRTFIGDIERAEKSPTITSLEKIAKALKVEIYKLFIEESYKTEE